MPCTFLNTSSNEFVRLFMSDGRGYYVYKASAVTTDYHDAAGAIAWNNVSFQKADSTAMGGLIFSATYNPFTFEGTKYTVAIHNTYAAVENREMTPYEAVGAGFLWSVPFYGFALYIGIMKTLR